MTSAVRSFQNVFMKPAGRGGGGSRMSVYDQENAQHEATQADLMRETQANEALAKQKQGMINSPVPPEGAAPAAHYGKRAGFDLGDIFGKNSVFNRAMQRQPEGGGAGGVLKNTASAIARDISPTHGAARDFARGFDPSNTESVMQMQERLNKSGYTDADGNPLAVDGVMGEKTEFALRGLQGSDNLDRGILGPGGETPVTPVGEAVVPVQRNILGTTSAPQTENFDFEPR